MDIDNDSLLITGHIISEDEIFEYLNMNPRKIFKCKDYIPYSFPMMTRNNKYQIESIEENIYIYRISDQGKSHHLDKYTVCKIKLN